MGINRMGMGGDGNLKKSMFGHLYFTCHTSANSDGRPLRTTTTSEDSITSALRRAVYTATVQL